MINYKDYKVSGRYAVALFQVSLENNQLENVLNDMLMVDELVKSSRELIVVFRSPIIGIEKKIKILNELFKDKVSDITLKFLILVTRKGRIVCLDAISDSYVKMYKDYLNIKTVYFESAVKIDSKTKERIISIMEKHTKLNVELHSKIDNDLIGGFKLKYDDYLYDASLKKELSKLKKEFAKNIYEKKF